MGFAEIDYINLKEDSKYEKIINQVIDKCFEVEKLQDKNLYINIILTTPEDIKKFNNEYRGIDKSTDVLSFPMFEREEINNIQEKGNSIHDVLGDVIISIEQVERQAVEYGHGFERELAYMIVHGFYHLMGYDHIEEKDKIEMRPKEEYILNKLKIVRE